MEDMRRKNLDLRINLLEVEKADLENLKRFLSEFLDESCSNRAPTKRKTASASSTAKTARQGELKIEDIWDEPIDFLRSTTTAPTLMTSSSPEPPSP